MKRTKAIHVGPLIGTLYDLGSVAGCFLGRIGGATTFASAKVKDAIGRIGIFYISFSCIVLQQVENLN